MPKTTTIISFAGSTRRDSFNKKLARYAVDIVKDLGSTAEFIDLRDYALPLYDGDIEQEQDYPSSALKLKEILKQSDGWLIASPEYNSSISAVLKNTLDWVSRSSEAGTDLSPFTGKVVALVAAAPGKLGGLRGLVHLRAILSNLGMIVIPNQLAIPSAMNAFSDDGKLVESWQDEQFRDVVTTLVDTSKRHKIDLHNYCKMLYNEYSFKD